MPQLRRLQPLRGRHGVCAGAQLRQLRGDLARPVRLHRGKHQRRPCVSFIRSTTGSSTVMSRSLKIAAASRGFMRFVELHQAAPVGLVALAGAPPRAPRAASAATAVRRPVAPAWSRPPPAPPRARRASLRAHRARSLRLRRSSSSDALAVADRRLGRRGSPSLLHRGRARLRCIRLRLFRRTHGARIRWVGAPDASASTVGSVTGSDGTVCAGRVIGSTSSQPAGTAARTSATDFTPSRPPSPASSPAAGAARALEDFMSARHPQGLQQVAFGLAAQARRSVPGSGDARDAASRRVPPSCRSAMARMRKSGDAPAIVRGASDTWHRVSMPARCRCVIVRRHARGRRPSAPARPAGRPDVRHAR